MHYLIELRDQIPRKGYKVLPSARNMGNKFAWKFK